MKAILREHRRWLLTAVGVLMLIVLIAGLGNLARPTPLRKVEEMTARLLAAEHDSSSSENRRNNWRDWHREIEHLPPALKREFWSQRGEQFRIWLQDFVRRSKQEQTEMLREILSQICEFRKHLAVISSGPNGLTELSPLEREKRQQEWLSMASPEERALVNHFLQMLAAEAQQLGLATTPSPWGDDAPT
jgi:hypothetical protein